MPVKLNRFFLIVFAFLFLLIVLIVGILLIYKKYSPSAYHVDKETEVDWNIAEGQRRYIENGTKKMPKQDISDKDIFSTPAMKIIKDKEIDEIAEKQQDPFTEMAELAKSRRKTYVMLDEKDLNKKINLSSRSIDDMRIQEYKGGSSLGYQAIYAPCDYIVFKSSSSWETFKQTHRVREVLLPDFSKENVVVIVSKSELPSGIFRIKKVSVEKKISYVDYYVDVFEMSEDNPEAKPNSYSAAIVPKDTVIKLRQLK